MISARGLTKVFDGYEAVEGIDVEVRPGEFFGFLGPERRGQELDHADDRLRVAARPAASCGCSVSTPWRDGPAIRARLGVSPRRTTSTLELSVWDNLIIYGRYFGIPRSVLKERAGRAARLRAAHRPARRQGRPAVGRA